MKFCEQIDVKMTLIFLLLICSEVSDHCFIFLVKYLTRIQRIYLHTTTKLMLKPEDKKKDGAR